MSSSDHMFHKSHEEFMQGSDEWWEDRLRHLDDGGMVAAACAMSAVGGAAVGLLVGLLIG